MALLFFIVATSLHLTHSLVANVTESYAPHEATSRAISDITKLSTAIEASSTISTATVESFASNFVSNTSRNVTRCKKNEFACTGSTACLPLSKKCNRHNDCGDWSDESDCDIVCANQTQVMCDPSFNASFNVSSSYSSDPFPGCYSLVKERCDGVFNCDNGADEKGCHGCPFNMYVCRNGKSCYSDANRCNGVPDCTDYTDEINCGFCPPNQTLCDPLTSLTACYDPIKDRCNRILDCSPGIDEKNCVGGCEGKISCSLGSGCFSPEERCNGMPDCSDYSDEKNCTASICRPDHGSFLCANRRCIRADWVCDRSNDCGDASDEINCLKNSVITAAIMGSLVCGLLLVIAISCTCKLIALRQAEAVRDSEHSASGHRGAFSSSYHRSDAITSCPRSLAALFDSDQPFFRIEPDPYFYREPPPSYAASVCPSSGMASAGTVLLSTSATGASLTCDSYDRSNRRARRLRRHHQRRRPPSPPDARTTCSDSALVGPFAAPPTSGHAIPCASVADGDTTVSVDSVSLAHLSSMNNGSSESISHSLPIDPLFDPLLLRDNCASSLAPVQTAGKSAPGSSVTLVVKSQMCEDALKQVNTSHDSSKASSLQSKSNSNCSGQQAKVSSRSSGRSLLTVIAGSGSSSDSTSTGHSNHATVNNKPYQFKKGDEEVSPILGNLQEEFNDDHEEPSTLSRDCATARDNMSTENSVDRAKSERDRSNRSLQIKGKSHLSSNASDERTFSLAPLAMVSSPASLSSRTKGPKVTSSVSSSAASSLSNADSEQGNNGRSGEGASIDSSNVIRKPCDQIELDSLMTVTTNSPSSNNDGDEEPLLS